MQSSQESWIQPHKILTKFGNSWVTLFNAYLVEPKWFATRHTPKSEEYLKNGIISSGVQVFLVHMFFLLGDGDTKEKASLIDNNHDIVSSVSKNLRLSNDLESEQDENQDGHDGSYVKCLLMEHDYSSVEIAREYVKKMISDTWKCLNQECLSPNPFSENFLKGSINLARLVPSMYSYNHNNSFDLIEEYIRSIL
ncbi:putative S-linalool synthase [Helianthus annuus]|uniref:Putative isoprenoid synthase domain-containing protein n=1 Tax=Helianthus annuus TaxID=4232 RepID=A0A251T7Y2_HELAN|nr:putative S-linalool synthase [Helianthus annuus]KAJ0502206.1 putative S-linalool synthase [Helianthus annuus]KAJ0510203.1 putative S-linalool synthase [Helianthus annuus]KAJ0518136.1 putative S-linalool synthase [Helianthus annuus]KAJ0686161.1 putative S-linalool synthase [Helianthus annuus]